jgi:hypothetical protein
MAVTSSGKILWMGDGSPKRDANPPAQITAAAQHAFVANGGRAIMSRRG